MEYLITYYIVSFLVSIGVACIFGAITKSINENKGYYGGFAWGFWLGVIGIIVVACRQPAYVPPKESIIKPAKPNPGDWQCRCGRYNARYASSCTCGLNKTDVIVPKKLETKNETDTINALKEYKDLLDSGIITQEEFDAKKKSLLS